VRVAYQGEPGAYSEEAALRHFPHATAVPFVTLDDVFRALAEGRVDAIMAHWALVSPRLVEAVGDAGGELYVWTVDDARRIAHLERLGVTGIITNDPRLFGAAAA